MGQFRNHGMQILKIVASRFRPNPSEAMESSFLVPHTEVVMSRVLEVLQHLLLAKINQTRFSRR